MRLADKRAVVTGAAHGIGEATARMFAREGARVVLVDIDADAGRQVAETIREAGGAADFLEADVTDSQAPEVVAARKRFEVVLADRPAPAPDDPLVVRYKKYLAKRKADRKRKKKRR